MKKNLLTKIRNRKGFTLAELLIVVAIIGVLVAVSIPIFTSQLTKSRQATNQANARSAKAAVVVWYLDQATTPTGDTTKVYTCSSGTIADGTALTAATVAAADADDQTKYDGTTVYKQVSVTIDKDGTVKSYGFGGN